MTSTPASGDDREQLRQQGLAAAHDAFNRMFAAAQQDHLVTFTPREIRAVVLGDELAAWLLEQHVRSDPRLTPRTPRRRAAPGVANPPGGERRPTSVCHADSYRHPSG